MGKKEVNNIQYNLEAWTGFGDKEPTAYSTSRRPCSRAVAQSVVSANVQKNQLHDS